MFNISLVSGMKNFFMQPCSPTPRPCVASMEP